MPDIEGSFWRLFFQTQCWTVRLNKKNSLFQDWLNEFNIAQDDLETSSGNANFNEVRLENFLRNKNPTQFHHQNDGYEAMDEDSEEDFVQIDEEVTVLVL